MSIGIYKITNPKGKIYIGQSINIERRFKEYKKLYCSQSRKLYYSLKKYGVETHLFEIIEECDTILLNEREEFYILLFKSHINGLNIKLASKPSWTGQKRPEHSILMKNKRTLCYVRTEEHKKHISNIMTGVWNIKKEEISKNISIGKMGKGVKPIICSTLFGLEFKSLTEASIVLGLNKGNICDVLKGNKKHIKGFTFIYKDFI
jgi:group I intron endonuclease